MYIQNNHIRIDLSTAGVLKDKIMKDQMKKHICWLNLLACSLSSVAALASAPKNKRIELQMSLPMINGGFLYCVHNPVTETIDFVTRDPENLQTIKGFPLNAITSYTDTKKYLLTLKGFAPITRGLLSVMVQSLNRHQDQLIFLHALLESNRISSSSSLTLNGKVKEIKIDETPAADLVITYLIQINKSLIVKGRQIVSLPFVLPTPPIVNVKVFKSIY